MPDNVSHKSRMAVQIQQKKSGDYSMHRNVLYLGGEEGDKDAGSQLHDL